MSARTRDRLIREKHRRKVLITTHEGVTWRALLMDTDEHTLSLLQVEQIAADGTATKADGQVLLPRTDVAFVQIP